MFFVLLCLIIYFSVDVDGDKFRSFTAGTEDQNAAGTEDQNAADQNAADQNAAGTEDQTAAGTELRTRTLRKQRSRTLRTRTLRTRTLRTRTLRTRTLRTRTLRTRTLRPLRKVRKLWYWEWKLFILWQIWSYILYVACSPQRVALKMSIKRLLFF